MQSEVNQNTAQMKIAFASDNPPLTKYPHCIFPISDGTFGTLLSVVSVPIGVWGNRPLEDANGDPYLEPEDGRILEDFELWALPKNQKSAKRMLFSTGFTMVIPADVSLDVLQKTYGMTNESGLLFDYDTSIAQVANLMPGLEWAFIPLYDHDYGIFVASHEKSQFVTDLKDRLRHAGTTKVFDVASTDRGQQWNGPIIWDTSAYFGAGQD